MKAGDVTTHPDPNKTAVIASISGGKDSTAMSLWLTERGIEHSRVFADTGWEHPATMEYVRDYLPGVLGPIDTAPAKYTMTELILRRGMFPTRMRRFCTQELKTRPIMRYLKSEDPSFAAINAIGLRAQESLARAVLDEWEYDANGFRRWVWRPLIRWTYDDVIAIHKRHNVRPNPLYLQGAERVGCWPCIFSRKAEIRLIASIDEGRIETIRKLENAVCAKATERYANDGESLDSKGYFPPTFFHSKDQKSRDLSGGMMPIDEVVKWSQTSHGGHQFEMFYEEAQDGCMRWGLCDSVGDLVLDGDGRGGAGVDSVPGR